MSNDLEDFQKFLSVREHASQAFAKGDPKPWGKILSTQDPTLFEGMGVFAKGTKQVYEAFEHTSSSIESGEVSYDVIKTDASAGLAYFVAWQNVKAKIKGVPQPIEIKLRATEIFKKEDSTWKLVHRHVDPAVPPGGGAQS